MTTHRLFRLAVTSVRDPTIETWLQKLPHDLSGLARRWFEFARYAGNDVREAMHDGCPTACVGDVAFAYVNAFTAHVNVGFFHGSALPDPQGLLSGSGKYMRHVKLRLGVDVDPATLELLISSAYDDVKRRIAE